MPISMPKKAFDIFYGSQTGNAEHIAATILRDALAQNYETTNADLEDFAKSPPEKSPLFVLVISTTGDGDPPESVIKFWRWMRKQKDAKPFAGARYSILGLGDTNYSQFCNTAKRFDKRFQEMGAERFYPNGYADDATGLEEVVDPWIEGLWGALEKELGLASTSPFSKTADHVVPSTSQDPSSTEDPIPVECSIIPDAPVPVPESSIITITPRSPLLVPAPKELSSVDPTPIDIDSPLSLAFPLSIDPIHEALSAISEITGIPKSPPARCAVTLIDADTSGHSPLVGGIEHYRHCLPAGSGSAPSLATLEGARCLTSVDAVKRTLHLEFAVPFDTVPGDAIGVLVPTPDDLVQAFAHRLGLPLSLRLRIDPATSAVALPSHLTALAGSTTTLDHLLRWSLDLTSTLALRKPLLRVLAEGAKDNPERKALLFLCSKQGMPIFSSMRDQGITLLDLLHTFPSIHVDLARLLDVLPALQPRSYSVTSTPLLTPSQVHIAFNVVRYEDQRGSPRHGLCTSWLDTITGTPPSLTSPPTPHVLPPSVPRVPMFLRPSTGFRLPDDHSKPIIMIGPGTGVAPFIGFIQHRAAQRALRWRMAGPEGVRSFGDTTLYYGCRDASRDFLYRPELEAATKDLSLTHLHLAESRVEGARWKYVGDALLSHAEDIWRAMDTQSAIIYVCGDAKAMAKSVDEALRTIVGRATGKEGKEVLDIIRQWSTDQRYLRDLWS